VNEKAWGLLPIELRSSVRLQVMKDLYLNTELFAFDGPWVMLKNDRKNLQGSFDLSAGLEFRVVKNVKVWAQFNNIFNREYQRWYQYPTYGFNFLGGVVFSFAQKNQ
jgi:outer membrane receptor protein involved in Fe transport